MCPGDLADCCNRDQRANYVGSVVDGDQDRIGLNSCPDIFGVQQPGWGTGHYGQVNALARQGSEWTHDRIMLHAGGDDMIPRPQQAAQTQIENFGHIRPQKPRAADRGH